MLVKILFEKNPRIGYQWPSVYVICVLYFVKYTVYSHPKVCTKQVRLEFKLDGSHVRRADNISCKTCCPIQLAYIYANKYV